MVELEMINLSQPVVKGIETFGNIVFWIVVSLFAMWVIGKFIANIGTLRGEDERVEPALVKEEV
jgi:hypothetical protein